MIDHSWQYIRRVAKRSARMLAAQDLKQQKKRIRRQYTNE